MIYVPRFVEKVSLAESKQTKDLVLPMQEARGLRDEIAKLLTELYDVNASKVPETMEVEIKGGNF